MGMLSLFPQILFLAPFGTTLLRVAAGITFLVVAWMHFDRRAALGEEEFIVIGRGAWIPIFAALVEFLVGGALVLGAYTQAAALIGALLAFKHFVWQRRYPQFFPLPRSTSALLFVICLSLLVTGAGIFAFDLPL
jgi:uncharacterized membrane protein YphA (DoxX/SURF4 family)